MSNFMQLGRDLYSAAEDIVALESRLDVGAEVTPEEYDQVTATFKAALDGARDKRDCVAYVLDKLEREIQLWHDYAQEDGKRAAAFERARERLKKLVVWSMTSLGSKVLEGNKRSFSIQQNGGRGRLVIDQPDAIPDDCYDTIRSVNQEKLRAAIAEGRVTESVAHIERGEHLRIR